MRAPGAAAFVLAAMVLPAAAQNESDWKTFFTYEGVSFSWSPASLQRAEDLRQVKWHDSANPQVVFKVQIDCKARTIKTLQAEEYDLNTGEYYQATDLSNGRTDDIGKPESMGAHLAQVVC